MTTIIDERDGSVWTLTPERWAAFQEHAKREVGWPE